MIACNNTMRHFYNNIISICIQHHNEWINKIKLHNIFIEDYLLKSIYWMFTFFGSLSGACFEYDNVNNPLLNDASMLLSVICSGSFQVLIAFKLSSCRSLMTYLKLMLSLLLLLSFFLVVLTVNLWSWIEISISSLLNPARSIEASYLSSYSRISSLR